MKIDKIEVGYLKTNCYFIIDNNDCVIVDPGDDFDKIDNYIKNNNLNVVAIFVTHYHFDHIGALNSCVGKYNVNVYSYKTYKSDDEEFNIKNFKFKIIDSRGHKDDLVTFYFKDEKVMFVGDFIFKDTIGRCDLEGSNFNDMLKNISKNKKYDDDITIYPGHGEKTNLGYEKKNNEYFL